MNQSSSISSRSSSTSTADESLLQQNQKQQPVTDCFDDLPPFETHLENDYPYDILTLHPLEIARQMTLMHSEHFKAIKPSELMSLGCNKPEQRPNVKKLADLSNSFVYWYAKCVVDTLNMEERVATMQRILEIAEYFDEMNNFTGLKEIEAAFGLSSMMRLERTREKSGLEEHRMYGRFKELFEHQRGYLERIKKCDSTCMPFIGFHLTYITKIIEQNNLNNEKHKEKIIEQQKELREAEAMANDAIKVFYFRIFVVVVVC